MRENRKKTIRTLLLIFILFLGLGFAALAANLKINGTLNVSRTAWDVHFENVQITEGSVTANPAPTTNNIDTTEMTYTINFTKPGDYFEFTTDIVNDGTIDAMVDVVSNNAYQNASSTTPITLPPYLTSTVTYSDGIEILPNQELLHNTSEKIKVRVEFKKDIEISDLPSSGDTSIVFKFKGDYKQADENAKEIRKVYKTGEKVLINDTEWFVISTSDSKVRLMSKWNINKAANSTTNKDDLFIELENDNSFRLIFDSTSNNYESSSIKSLIEGNFRQAINNTLNLNISPSDISIWNKDDLIQLGCSLNIVNNGASYYVDYDGIVCDSTKSWYNDIFKITRSWINIPHKESINSWVVFENANFNPVNVYNEYYAGVRPVIEIEKSKLN